MKLTVWTYEGPPHVGAMRVATAMKGLHYVLHAPQGDAYADLLFTMIERRDHRRLFLKSLAKMPLIASSLKRSLLVRLVRLS